MGTNVTENIKIEPRRSYIATS